MDFLDGLTALLDLLSMDFRPSQRADSRPAWLIPVALLLLLTGLVLLMPALPTVSTVSVQVVAWCGGAALLLALGGAYGLFLLRVVESYRPAGFILLVIAFTLLFALALLYGAAVWWQPA